MSVAYTPRDRKKMEILREIKNAVARDRTRVTRVTGGNTYHYTTTTLLLEILGMENLKDLETVDRHRIHTGVYAEPRNFQTIILLLPKGDALNLASLHQTSHPPSTLPAGGKSSIHDKTKFILLLAAPLWMAMTLFGQKVSLLHHFVRPARFHIYWTGRS
ncbi:hypothetical protein ACLB2K_010480 [Fragaria x ananassa]